MSKVLVDVPELHEVNEAAGLIGIGYATLFRWIKKGKIIPVRVNRRTLIPKYEIERAKLLVERDADETRNKT